MLAMRSIANQDTASHYPVRYGQVDLMRQQQKYRSFHATMVYLTIVQDEHHNP